MIRTLRSFNKTHDNWLVDIEPCEEKINYNKLKANIIGGIN